VLKRLRHLVDHLILATIAASVLAACAFPFTLWASYGPSEYRNLDRLWIRSTLTAGLPSIAVFYSRTSDTYTLAVWRDRQQICYTDPMRLPP
jgi:hypothetical protein